MKREIKPPIWWTKVINDLERATMAAKKSFKKPNTIIGFLEDDNGNKKGVLVRLRDGKVGYFLKEGDGRLPLVGSALKGNLPKPDRMSKEPAIAAFVFEAIRERVPLLPYLWLRSVVTTMLEGKPITGEHFKKEFPDWVRVHEKYRDDRALKDILYRVTQYEGLLGLERFKDKAP